MQSPPQIKWMFMLAWGVALPAVAQGQPAVPAVTAQAPLSFEQTKGYARAELTTPRGEKYLVYVPLNALGFGELLPFFKREEDIETLPQPLFLSVDDVQSVYVPSTGLYLEHMVVKGKRQHVLGVRMLEGAVELFSYVQARSGAPGLPVTPVAYSRREWYLRRQGELVAVSRGSFVKQMAAYLQDDPVLVEAITNKKMGYNDTRMLVRLYNEHRATAGTTK